LALRVGVDARGVVVGPFVLSLRCSCRRSALHAVAGPFALPFAPAVSSFGSSCCRWAVGVDVDPAVSSLRAVVGLFMLALTPPCHRGSFLRRTGWASHSLGPPFGHSFPFVSSSIKRAHIPLLRGGAPVGLSEVEGRGGNGGDGGGGGVKRE
jgi:hypothetical protein